MYYSRVTFLCSGPPSTLLETCCMIILHVKLHDILTFFIDFHSCILQGELSDSDEEMRIVRRPSGSSLRNVSYMRGQLNPMMDEARSTQVWNFSGFIWLQLLRSTWILYLAFAKIRGEWSGKLNDAIARSRLVCQCFSTVFVPLTIFKRNFARGPLQEKHG